MASKEIELSAGGTMPAFVAEPTMTPRGGVIVVQEIFGVSNPMKNVAELLASEGYLAIVPALFHRIDPHFAADADAAGFARGREAAQLATLHDITLDLSVAATYLQERLGPAARIAVWGFCFGGTVAYLAATLPFVQKSIAFYGGAIATQFAGTIPLEHTERIHAPLMLAFGADDEHIPAQDVATIESALRTAGKAFDLHSYPGAGHGFFRPGPTSSDAAAQAWTRVKAFLAT